MARSRFLAQIASWPLAAFVPIPFSPLFSAQREASLFPFSHAHALSEAAHEVRILLLGEAVTLMRRSVAEAVVPVGWPPVGELLAKVRGRIVLTLYGPG
jgi:hypothetical protein